MKIPRIAVLVATALTLGACNGNILPQANIVSSTSGARVDVVLTLKVDKATRAVLSESVGYTYEQPTATFIATYGSPGVTITSAEMTFSTPTDPNFGGAFHKYSSSLGVVVTSGYTCSATAAPEGTNCPISDPSTVPSTGTAVQAEVPLLEKALTDIIAGHVASSDPGVTVYRASVVYRGFDSNGQPVSITENNVQITVTLDIQEEEVEATPAA